MANRAAAPAAAAPAAASISANAVVRVRDGNHRLWYLRRRFTPWRGVVQPFHIAIENTYFRYAVPAGAAHPMGPEEGRKPLPRTLRKERRQAEREESLGRLNGWEWMWKFPLLLVFLLAMVVFGQAIELLALLLWLALFAISLIEMAAQLIVVLPLLVARMLGLVSSRVDVFREQENHLASLTVLHVPGYRRAGRLTSALAERRRAADRPFDPIHDPQIAMLLQEYQAVVVRHDSLEAEAYEPLTEPRHRRA